MGYRNNPLMEPEFFTPRDPKRLYKGRRKRHTVLR